MDLKSHSLIVTCINNQVPVETEAAINGLDCTFATDETEYTGTDVLFEFEFLGAQMYYQANVHITIVNLHQLGLFNFILKATIMPNHAATF